MISRFLKARCTARPIKLKQQLSLAIGQKRRAEAALSATREENAQLKTRFDLMRNATGDGLWDMETSGTNQIVASNAFWWSDQFRRLLGFHDQLDFPNVLGSWASRLHPEDVAATLAAFAAHIDDRSDRTPYDVTYRLQCRNGDYRWFSAHGKSIRAADGTALRVAGSLTDMTDRNAILELKRYAEDILASLPTGLVVVDDALCVKSVNRSLRTILGLSIADDLCGRGLDAILPHAGLREYAQAILAGGAAVGGIEFAHGRQQLRVAIAGIGIGHAENARRLLIVVEDVTEQQQLRAQARA
jgi:PAS domain S-box-containing protein